MKTIRRCALFAVLASVPFADSSACSAIIVGRRASATGRVIVSHNDDGSLSLKVRHALVPAREGKLGFFWTEFKDPKGGVTPGDTMLNERGVLIMSNNGGFMKTWMGRPGALPDEGDYSSLTDGGVGFEFRRTIAEQARSAREGVDIATNLLTRFGYNRDSRNFAIADRDEAWVVEVIRGRRYVARRCPDDAVVAYPNCLTVTRIEPGDIVSGNIEARRDTFDFTAAYQGPRSWRSPYNLYRMRYLYKGVCGFDPGEPGVYPFSLKPQTPVAAERIMSTLSTHYEGTPDAVCPHPTKQEEVTERRKAPICRIGTLESIVCIFSDNVTNIEMKVATGRPCETPYASYRPFGGILPTDVSRGEEALRRLDNRAEPLPAPVKVGVFVGNGPRANGMAEYLRLVNDSPDLDLTLLDADDIRAGGLDRVDLLVMPGGDSRTEKRDLGGKGAEQIRRFLRNGGGYIGSCAGCCLLMDAVMDPERGIGIIPYHRTGSKGGYMMPVKVNAKGAAALGIEERSYTIRYHGGPVLEPSTNAIDGANFEIWGTYEEDFGKPGAKPEMKGRGAIVGGTYGKGRVFAFSVHPENFPCTRELVRGAFRYVTGHDVAFPERKRKVGAYSVGWYSNAVAGKDVSRTMLEIDGMEGVDLFPMASDEILVGMLDHVDMLVIPDGNAKFYRSKVKPEVKTLIAAFQSRGGTVIGWGEGAKACAGLARDVKSSREAVRAIAERLRPSARAKCESGHEPVLPLVRETVSRTGMFRNGDGGFADRFADAAVRWTDEGLVVRVRRRLGSDETLKAAGKADDPPSMFALGDSTVEVLLAPHRDRPEVFYQFGVNPSNVLYQARRFDTSWRPAKPVKTAPFFGEGEWGAEFRIPFGAFDEDPVAEGCEWRAEFSCGRYDWAGVPGRHDPALYGVLRFGDRPQRAYLEDLRRTEDGRMLVTYAFAPGVDSFEQPHKAMEDTDLRLIANGTEVAGLFLPAKGGDPEAVALDKYYYAPGDTVVYTAREFSGRCAVAVRRIATGEVVRRAESSGAGALECGRLEPGDYAFEVSNGVRFAACQFEVRDEDALAVDGPLGILPTDPLVLTVGKDGRAGVPFYPVIGSQHLKSPVSIHGSVPLKYVKEPIAGYLVDPERTLRGAEANLEKERGSGLWFNRLAYEAQIKLLEQSSTGGMPRVLPSNGAYFLDLYRKLKAKFPGKVFSIQTDYAGMASELAPACDVFELAAGGCSYSANPLKEIRRALTTARSAAPGKPVMFWLGGSLPDRARYRSADEANTAVRYCILRGMAGNVFHMGHGGVPEDRVRLWSFLRGVENAVNAWYPDWVLGRELDVKASCEDGVEVGVRKSSGGYVLVAVNLNPYCRSFSYDDPAGGVRRTVRLTGYGSAVLRK